MDTTSMLSLSGSTLPASVRLTDQSSYPAWFAQLKYHAKARGIWSQVDPDAPATPGASQPEFPEDGASEEDLRMYQIKMTIHTQIAARTQVLWNWVIATVDPQRLELALLRSSDESLQALLVELKKELCPSKESWKEQVRQVYREALLLPTLRSATPENWILEWSRAYTNAQIQDLDEIKGTLPIKDFLRAAQTYDPTWAQSELDSLLRPGATPLTLDQYARWFSQIIQQRSTRSSVVFATLGVSPSTDDDSRGKCPCKEKAQHRWAPIDCYRLQYAIRGYSDGEIELSPKQIEAIKRRLKEKRWQELRKEIEEAGWESSSKYPGKITA